MSQKYQFRNPVGLYFTTLTVVDWIDVFSRPDYRTIVLESLSFCREKKGLNLYAWCLMTNHMHLLISAKDGFGLPDIIRDFKKYTSSTILKSIENHSGESRREWLLRSFRFHGRHTPGNETYALWQRGSHPIEVFSPEVITQKLDYIHNNPVDAQIVDSPEHYLYSSARDFCGHKGLIELDQL